MRLKRSGVGVGGGMSVGVGDGVAVSVGVGLNSPGDPFDQPGLVAAPGLLAHNLGVSLPELRDGHLLHGGHLGRDVDIHSGFLSDSGCLLTRGHSEPFLRDNLKACRRRFFVAGSFRRE